LQADFMPVIHGILSFEGLRARGIDRQVNGIPLRIACLDDLVARKKAAGRDRRGDAMPTKNAGHQVGSRRRAGPGSMLAPRNRIGNSTS
jgi:hypothetical protein